MQQEADAAAATAAAKVAQAKAAEREAIAAANAAAEQMEGVDLVRRRSRAILMVSALDVEGDRLLPYDLLRPFPIHGHRQVILVDISNSVVCSPRTTDDIWYLFTKWVRCSL